MPRLGNGRDDPEERCTSPINCAMCDEPLDSLSENERQLHYETHFHEPEEKPHVHVQEYSNLDLLVSNNVASTSSSPPKLRPSLFPIPKSAGRFWTASHAAHSKPPSNYTPNLIPIIRRALIKTHAKGTTQRAAVCQDGLCHISREFFDSTYGCGYRNFMMACSSLYEQEVMPQYFSLLEVDGGPSFRNCQEWMEKAWLDGFDQVGATQLKHKVVGTMKWIGTAELYTVYTYRGIPARLVDFPDSGSHPEVVTKWVSEYFFPPNATGNVQTALSGVSPVIQTEKPPLILQHQGHSRTIVGIEIDRTGAPNLLIFDPGKTIPTALRKQALASLPTPKTSDSPAKSSSLTKAKLDNFFHKRPRFADTDDEDDDSQQPESKRGKFEGSNSVSKKPGDSNTKLQGATSEVDPLSVLKVFRVNLTNLKKKDKYQILAFTLDPPLTEAERQARRIVTSEKVV